MFNFFSFYLYRKEYAFFIIYERNMKNYECTKAEIAREYIGQEFSHMERIALLDGLLNNRNLG